MPALTLVLALFTLRSPIAVAWSPSATVAPVTAAEQARGAAREPDAGLEDVQQKAESPRLSPPEELPALRALDIGDYTDDTNDRFTDSPSFIASAFDLSGVGQDTNGRWATAISRNVVLSANHFSPSGTVSFFPGNDASAPAVERSVASGTAVPGTDLYLAVLDADLPSSIRHYAYAAEPLSGDPPGVGAIPAASAGVYQDVNAYLLGRSPKANPAIQDQAVGRNRVSGYAENVPFLMLSDADVLIFVQDAEDDPNHVTYESRLAGGDSGGPTFVDDGGELKLLGTNAFIYDDGSFTVPGAGSGISYTGNQASWIADYVADNANAADLAITVTELPDPVVGGETVTFTVTVTNAGPDPAVDVRVAVALPVELTFVASSGCANDPDGAPTCELGDVAVGVPVEVTIEGTADPAGDGVLVTQLQVVASTADPNAANDTAEEATSILPRGLLRDDFETGDTTRWSNAQSGASVTVVNDRGSAEAASPGARRVSPGTSQQSPRSTNSSPKRARSEATRRSAISASSIPQPTAAPLTAAITGVSV